MNVLRIIFFGSTSDSIIVLSRLHQLGIVPRSGIPLRGRNWSLEIASVVTQPPRPFGRKQTVTPTPVEIWTKKHNIPILSFPSNPDRPWMYADENQVIDTLEPFKADLVVSACYGQKIPEKTISDAHFGGLNVHPSLLPRWRGADPVPWAILSGDHQTGVTIVTLSQKFDEGSIVAQKKLPIISTDTSDTLRTKLFTIGGDLFVESIASVIANEVKQSHTNVRSLRRKNGLAMTHYPYARRLTRQDGFESWGTIQKSFLDPDEAKRIDRKFRAFMPWPGVWTLVRIMNLELGIAEEKRLKILTLHLSPTTDYLLIDTVQLEGKKPVTWIQFQKAYLTT